MDSKQFNAVASGSRVTRRETIPLKVIGKTEAEMEVIWANGLAELAREPKAESRATVRKPPDGSDAMTRGGLTLFACRSIAAAHGTAKQIADSYRTHQAAVKAIKAGSHWSSRWIATETIAALAVPAPPMLRRPSKPEAVEAGPPLRPPAPAKVAPTVKAQPAPRAKTPKPAPKPKPPPAPKPTRSRTNSPHASLETCQAVAQAAGTLAEVAARYGISSATVSKIKSGKHCS